MRQLQEDYRYLAVAWSFPGRCMPVTLTLNCRYIAVKLPLHYRYTARQLHEVATTTAQELRRGMECAFGAWLVIGEMPPALIEEHSEVRHGRYLAVTRSLHDGYIGEMPLALIEEHTEVRHGRVTFKAPLNRCRLMMIDVTLPLHFRYMASR